MKPEYIHRMHTATVNDEGVWAPCVSEGDDVEDGDVDVPPAPVLQRPQDHRRLDIKMTRTCVSYGFALVISFYNPLSHPLSSFSFAMAAATSSGVWLPHRSLPDTKQANKQGTEYYNRWKTAWNEARLPTRWVFTIHTYTHIIMKKNIYVCVPAHTRRTRAPFFTRPLLHNHPGRRRYTNNQKGQATGLNIEQKTKSKILLFFVNFFVHSNNKKPDT